MDRRHYRTKEAMRTRAARLSLCCMAFLEEHYAALQAQVRGRRLHSAKFVYHHVRVERRYTILK